MLYCKTKDGWKRLPAVIGGNNKVSPGKGLLNGKPTQFEQYQYVLRFYDGSKVKYQSIGADAKDAKLKLAQKERSLEARVSANAANAVIVEEPSRMSLRRQLERFLDVVRDRGSKEAAIAYKLALNEFLKVVGKTYSDELDDDDMRKFVRTLRGRGLTDRTLYNRHSSVKAFLRFCGLEVRKLAPTAPKFEKPLPEVYTAEQITAFFPALISDYDKVVFNLLLKCGLREQEAMYLCWPDVNFATRTLLVRAKPDLGFMPKDKEQREVPLPDDLVEMLKAWKAKHPHTRLVIGTGKGKPNTKLLRLVKRLAYGAGVNCGACDGCKDRNECEVWYLHKFRATYCTKLLRSGMDLRTVQSLMGHSDLKSTMRYLRPSETSAVRDRVAAINWGAD
jgi:integrase